ncbi:hypothetical protein [Methanolapillus millepedarum]|uniref:Immunoglobulin domain-containing protein n=1 Tax=Methanolapillus millepedarum TaxID=3028296 RepID=A0AA96V3W1_9EURY|nr:hypothetical protein MsAc7_16410 [Methanosarcinaceae archaeon Ac7]
MKNMNILSIFMVFLLFTGSIVTADVVAADSDPGLTATWYLVTYDGEGGESSRLLGTQSFSGPRGGTAEISAFDISDGFVFSENFNQSGFSWDDYKADDPKTGSSNGMLNVTYGLNSEVTFYITAKTGSDDLIVGGGAGDGWVASGSDDILIPGGDVWVAKWYKVTKKLNTSSNPASMVDEITLVETKPLTPVGTTVTVNSTDFTPNVAKINQDPTHQWTFAQSYVRPATAVGAEGAAGAANANMIVNTDGAPGGEICFYFTPPDWEYVLETPSEIASGNSSKVIVYTSRGWFEVMAKSGDGERPNNFDNSHITYVRLGADINQRDDRPNGTFWINRKKPSLTIDGARDPTNPGSSEEDWYKYVQYFIGGMYGALRTEVMHLNEQDGLGVFNNSNAPLTGFTWKNTYIIGANGYGVICSGYVNTNYVHTYENIFYVGPQIIWNANGTTNFKDVTIVIDDPRYKNNSQINYTDENGTLQTIKLNLTDNRSYGTSYWGEAAETVDATMSGKVRIYKSNFNGDTVNIGVFRIWKAGTIRVSDNADVKIYSYHHPDDIYSRQDPFVGQGSVKYNFIVGNNSNFTFLNDYLFTYSGEATNAVKFEVGENSTVNLTSKMVNGGLGTYVNFTDNLKMGKHSLMNIEVTNSNHTRSIVEFGGPITLDDRSKLTVKGNFTNTSTSTGMVKSNNTSISTGGEVYIINNGTGTAFYSNNLTVDKLAVFHVVGNGISSPSIPAANVLNLRIDRIENVLFYNNGTGPGLKIRSNAANNMNLTNMESIKYWNNTSTGTYNLSTKIIDGTPSYNWSQDLTPNIGFNVTAWINSSGVITGTNNLTVISYIPATGALPEITKEKLSLNESNNFKRIVSFEGLAGPYSVILHWNDPSNKVTEGLGYYDFPITRDINLTAEMPDNPYHVFSGWYLDNTTFQNAYNLNTLVTGPVELYGTWVSDGSVLITTHPTDKAVFEGQTATFNVVAINAGSYQWQKSTDGGMTFNDISEASSSSYTTDVTAMTDNQTKFRVVVSGVAVSSAATLTVISLTEAVSITTQPADKIVVEGQMTTFDVVATNAASYQWQKSTDGGVTFYNIPWASSSSYTTDITEMDDDQTEFRVVVTGVHGDTAISTNATLTVIAAGTGVSITQGPQDTTVAVGNTAEMYVIATNAASYQWQKNVSGVWTNVGTDSPILEFPNAQSSDTGFYRVVVTGTAGDTAISNEAELTVTNADGTTVLISTNPVDQTVAVGNTAEFNVIAANADTYQWQKYNTTTLLWDSVGTNSSVLTLPDAQDDDAGIYRVWITGTAGDTAISTNATLTVIAAGTGVSITQGPQDTTVAVGNTAEMYVIATNAASYQWQKNVSGVWTNVGTDSPILEFPNAQSSDTGFYRVVVTGTAGDTAISNEAELTVTNADGTTVLISTNPVDQTVAVGNTAEFNVIAANADTYQWQKYNTTTLLWDSVGTNSSVLTLPDAQDDDAGIYRVWITGTAGDTAISTNATLTVIAAGTGVSITQGPQDTTVAVGNTAEMYVIATNAASYQWQKNVSGVWTNVGTDSPILEFPNAQSSDTGFYRVVVTGTAGDTAISNEAELTVTNADGTTVLISTNPVDQTVAVGNTAEFNVIAANADTYQWQKYNTTTLLWDSVGTNSSVLTLPDAQDDDAGIYRVWITGTAGDTAISTNATLTVIAAGTGVSITQGPQDTTVAVGNTAEMYVIATNAASYQWQKNVSGVWTNVGTDSPILEFPNAQSSDTGFYRVVVTGTAGDTAISNEAELTVTNADGTTVLISTNPVDQTVAVGNTAEFNVIAANADTYQWQKYNTTTLLWDSVGTNSSVLTLPDAQDDDAGIYRVWITGTAGDTAISTNATLTVIAAGTGVSITQGPQDTTVAVGNTAEMYVIATNAASYQWQKNVSGVWTNVGTDSPILEFPNAQSSDTGFYRVVVTGTAGDTAISNEAELTVTNADGTTVLISTNPVDQTVAVGNTAEFNVIAANADTYQWQKYNTTTLLWDSVGTNSSVLTLPDAQDDDAGIYRVWITGTAGDTAISTNATLTVIAAGTGVSITQGPQDTTVAVGNTAEMYVIATNAASYQWQKNVSGVWTNVGTDSPILEFPNAQSSDTGFYRVVVTGTAGDTAISNEAELTVTNADGTTVLISTNPVDQTVAVGNTAEFNVIAANADTYQWQKYNTTTLLWDSVGTNSSVLTLPDAQDDDAGIYRVWITGTAGDTAISTNATLTVIAAGTGVSITQGPQDTTVAVGNTAEMYVIATNAASYQWQKNVSGVWTNVGTDSPILEFPNAQSSDTGFYRVVVTGTAGDTAISNEAELTVTNADGTTVLISTNPVDQTVAVGNTAEFNVIAANADTYQWQKYNTTTLLWDSVGTNSSVLTLPDAQDDDAGIYRVWITGTAGDTAISTNATLTVIAAGTGVSITQGPQDTTVAVGNTAEMYVIATNAASYQWQKNVSGVWTNVGTDSPILEFPNAQSSDTGFYRVVVTGTAGDTAISNEAELTVTNADGTTVLISTNPVDQTVAVGNTAEFNVIAANADTYQWQKYNTTTLLWDSVGTNSSVLTLPDAQDDDAGIYRVWITGTAGDTAISTNATLTVIAAGTGVSITQGPQDTTVAVGNTAEMYVIATNAASYQWQKNVSGVWTNVGTDSPILEFPNAQSSDTGFYRVVVTGTAGDTAISNEAELTVTNADGTTVLISTNPVDQTVAVGNTAEFNVIAANADTYQWQKYNTTTLLWDSVGTNSSVLTLPDAQDDDAGIYRVWITGTAGDTAISTNATLTVIAAGTGVSITQGPQDTTVAVGNTAEMYVIATNAASYQWQKNVSGVWTNVGTDSPILEFPNAQSSDTGFYRVVVTGTAGDTAISNEAELTVTNADGTTVLISTNPVDQTVAVGNTAEFNVIAANADTYQWQKYNTTTLLWDSVGTNSSVLTLPDAQDDDAGIYRVWITGTAGDTAISTNATLTVIAAGTGVSITQGPQDTTVAVGNTAEMYVIATNAASYQWQKNVSGVWTNVGTDSPILEFPNAQSSDTGFYRVVVTGTAGDTAISNEAELTVTNADGTTVLISTNPVDQTVAVGNTAEFNVIAANADTYQWQKYNTTTLLWDSVGTNSSVLTLPDAQDDDAGIYRVWITGTAGDTAISTNATLTVIAAGTGVSITQGPQDTTVAVGNTAEMYVIATNAASYQWQKNVSGVWTNVGTDSPILEFPNAQSSDTGFYRVVVTGTAGDTAISNEAELTVTNADGTTVLISTNPVDQTVAVGNTAEFNVIAANADTYQWQKYNTTTLLWDSVGTNSSVLTLPDAQDDDAGIYRVWITGTAGDTAISTNATLTVIAAGTGVSITQGPQDTTVAVGNTAEMYVIATNAASYQWQKNVSGVWTNVGTDSPILEFPNAQSSDTGFYRVVVTGTAGDTAISNEAELTVTNADGTTVLISTNPVDQTVAVGNTAEFNVIAANADTYQWQKYNTTTLLWDSVGTNSSVLTLPDAQDDDAGIYRVWITGTAGDTAISTNATLTVIAAGTGVSITQGPQDTTVAVGNTAEMYVIATNAASYQWQKNVSGVWTNVGTDSPILEFPNAQSSDTGFYRVVVTGTAGDTAISNEAELTVTNADGTTVLISTNPVDQTVAVGNTAEFNVIAANADTYQWQKYNTTTLLWDSVGTNSSVLTLPDAQDDDAGIYRVWITGTAGDTAISTNATLTVIAAGTGVSITQGPQDTTVAVGNTAEMYVIATNAASYQWQKNVSGVWTNVGTDSPILEFPNAQSSDTGFYRVVVTGTAGDTAISNEAELTVTNADGTTVLISTNPVDQTVAVGNTAEFNVIAANADTYQWQKYNTTTLLWDSVGTNSSVLTLPDAQDDDAGIYRVWITGTAGDTAISTNATLTVIAAGTGVSITQGPQDTTVAVGNTAEMYVIATNAASYQWQKNVSGVWTNVGTDSPILEFPNAQSSDTGFYRVVVTGTAGDTAISNEAELTVTNADGTTVLISTNPVDQTVAVGNTAEFNVIAANADTYQWQKYNTTTLLWDSVGTNSSVLTLPDAQDDDAGIYRVWITGTAGDTAISTNATLTVIAAGTGVSITQGPQDTTVAVGNTAEMYVIATNAASYQWQKNVSGVWTNVGTDSPILEFPNAQSSDTGFYRVVVTGTAGDTAISNEAELTVTNADGTTVLISTNPVDQTVAVGNTAEFNVIAANADTYQWQKYNTTTLLWDSVGTNSSVLTLPDAQDDDAGIYRVWITGTAGDTAISTNATLTVIAAGTGVSITQGPQDTTVAVGNTAEMYVIATNAASYQWQKNVSGVWTNVGTDSPILEFPNAQSSDTGFYRVVVTGTAGDTAISNEAELTVTNADGTTVLISTNPVDQTVAVGNTAEFNVIAANADTYQWQKYNTTTLLWDSVGTNSSVLTLPDAQDDDAGIYRVWITGTAGDTAISTNATLTVIAAGTGVSITQGPQDTTVAVGNTAEMYVIATNAASYQWQKNVSGVWTNVGTDSPILEFPNAQSSDTGFYRVVVTGTAGDTAISNEAELTVTNADGTTVLISTNPVDQTVAVGNTAEFNVIAANADTYQWQKYNTTTLLWDSVGTNSSVLTLPDAQDDDAGIYRVWITGTAGDTAISTNATLTVIAAGTGVSITQGPQDTTVAVGNTAEMYVIATNAASYQWQKNVSGVWTNVGTDSPILEFPNAQSSDTGFYRVVVTGTAGDTAISNEAELTVTNADGTTVLISTNPVDQTVAVGNTAEFNVIAANADTYQWQKYNTTTLLWDSVGTNSSVLTLPDAQDDDAGIYRVWITGTAGDTAISTNATLTVIAAGTGVSITQGPQDTTVAVGNTAEMYVIATNAASYQWQKNVSGVWTNVGTDSPILEFPNAQSSDTGFYRVVVTGTAGDTAISNEAELTVTNADGTTVLISTNPVDQTVAVGNTAEFNVIAANADTYQWQKYNTTTLLWDSVGTNSSVLTLPDAQDDDAGIYRVWITGTAGDTAISTNATLTVIAAGTGVSITQGPQDTTVAVGNTAEMYVIATNAASYQWQKNVSGVWTNVGTDSPILEFPNAQSSDTGFYRVVVTGTAGDTAISNEAELTVTNADGTTVLISTNPVDQTVAVGNTAEFNVIAANADTYQWQKYNTTTLLWDSVGTNSSVLTLPDAQDDDAGIYRVWITGTAGDTAISTNATLTVIAAGTGVSITQGPQDTTVAVGNTAEMYVIATNAASYQWQKNVSGVWTNVGTDSPILEFPNAQSSDTGFYRVVVTGTAGDTAISNEAELTVTNADGTTVLISTNPVDQTVAVGNTAEFNVIAANADTYQWQKYNTTTLLWDSVGTNSSVLTLPDAQDDDAGIYRVWITGTAGDTAISTNATLTVIAAGTGVSITQGPQDTTVAVGNTAEMYVIATNAASYQWQKNVSGVWTNVGTDSPILEFPNAQSSDTGFYRVVVTGTAGDTAISNEAELTVTNADGTTVLISTNPVDQTVAVGNTAEFNVIAANADTYQWQKYNTTTLLWDSVGTNSSVLTLPDAQDDDAGIYRVWITGTAGDTAISTNATLTVIAAGTGVSITQGPQDTTVAVGNTAEMYVIATNAASYQWQKNVSGVWTNVGTDSPILEFPNAQSSDTGFYRVVVTGTAGDTAISNEAELTVTNADGTTVLISTNPVDQTVAVGNTAEFNVIAANADTYQWQKYNTTTLLWDSVGTNSSVLTLPDAQDDDAGIYRVWITGTAGDTAISTNATLTVIAAGTGVSITQGPQDTTVAVGNTAEMYVIATNAASYQWQKNVSGVWTNVGTDSPILEFPNAQSSDTGFYRVVVTGTAGDTAISNEAELTVTNADGTTVLISTNPVDQTVAVGNTAEFNVIAANADTYQWQKYNTTTLLWDSVGTNSSVLTLPDAQDDDAGIYRVWITGTAGDTAISTNATLTVIAAGTGVSITQGPQDTTVAVGNTAEMYVIATNAASYQWQKNVSGVWTNVGTDSPILEFPNAQSSDTGFYRVVVTGTAGDTAISNEAELTVTNADGTTVLISTNPVDQTVAVGNTAEFNVIAANADTYQWQKYNTTTLLWDSVGTNSSVLTLPDAQDDDAGIYRVWITGTAGDTAISTNATLTVIAAGTGVSITQGPQDTTVAVGNTAEMYVIATNAASYQWQKNVSGVWTNVGTDSPILEFPNAQSSDTGFYRVVVTGTAGDTAISNEAELTVTNADGTTVLISTNPVDQTVAVGNTAEFNVIAANADTYQWQKYNTTTLLWDSVGTNSSVLTLPDAQDDDAGIYRVWITGTAGDTAISTNATLTVIAAGTGVSITQGPQDTTVAVGNTAEMYVIATNAASYQWQKNVSGVWTNVGTDSPILEFPNAQSSDTGFYRVVVTGTAGDTAISNEAELTVTNADGTTVLISTNPVDQTVAVGNTAEFNVIAANADTYQWQKYNTTTLLWDSVGTNSSVLTLPDAQDDDAGIYRVWITGTAGDTAISTNATLTVIAAGTGVSITQGPQDTTVAVGNTAEMYVIATNAASYQWQKNVSGVWTNVGTDSPILEFPNAQSSDTGFYRVVVTGTAGDTAISNEAELTVTNADGTTVLISTNPVDQTVAVGNTAEFNVIAANADTYQWQKYNTTTLLWDSVGTNSSVLTLPDAQDDDAGIYRVWITGTAGDTAISTNATLTVIAAGTGVSITQGPQDTTVAVGNTAEMYVIATNAASYQWQKNVSGVWTNVGTDSPILEFPNAQSSDTGFYRVVVTGTAGDTAISNEAELTVTNADGTTVLISTNPVDQTVAVGNTAEFNVIAANADTYQWQKYNTTTLLWDSVGTNSSVLTLPDAQDDDAGIYRVWITGTAGDTAISTNATLTVIAAGTGVSITQGPQDTTVAVGNTAEMYVIATNAASYQWQKNVSGVWTNVGTDSPILEFPNAQSSDTGFYRVVVTGTAGDTAISNEAELTVTNADGTTVLISTNPVDQTVAVGNTAEFNVIAANADTYQWQKYNTTTLLWDSVGTNSSVLTLPDAQDDDAGIYRVWITGTAGDTAISTNATLTVIAAGTGVSITQGPQDTTVAVGNTAEMYVIATNAASYQWQKNVSGVWTNVGTDSPILEFPNAQSSDTGFYRVVVTGTAGDTAISNEAELTVTNADGTTVLISTNPVDQTVAVGNTAEFNVIAANADTYQWQKYNTTTLLWDSVGTNSSVLTLPDAQDDDAGIYRVWITGTAGDTAISTNATLTVIAAGTGVSITQGPQDTTVAVGNTAEMYVIATNAASYQWQKNVSGVWTNVGTDSPILEFPNAQSSDTGFYRVVVTGTAGDTAISNEAELTVTNADGTTVLISTNPVDQTVAVGNTAEFNVIAANADTYQWQKYNTTTLLWDSVGTNSSVLTLPDAQDDDAGIYRVWITGTAGDTAISTNATLTVIPGETPSSGGTGGAKVIDREDDGGFGLEEEEGQPSDSGKNITLPEDAGRKIPKIPWIFLLLLLLILSFFFFIIWRRRKKEEEEEGKV